MKITLIIGLPGSGKTTLAYKLANEDKTNHIKTCVVDDIVDQNQLPNDNDCEHLIITDVNFCDEGLLTKAVARLNKLYKNVAIIYIYFENNQEQCRHNVEHRNDGRNVEGTIIRFAPIYKVPNNITPIEVPQPNKENDNG